MEQNENNECQGNYQFDIEAGADVLTASLLRGDLDIALVPANVASIMYSKSAGEICVTDINTLGVLYVVGMDESITSISDLQGKTVYTMGKGTTPDFVMQYMLEAENVDAATVNFEYKSEGAEVVGALMNDPEAVGVLPQPFAGAALAQNPDMHMLVDITKAWDESENTGSAVLVTGVTVVRKEFLENNPEAVKIFMEEHEASANYACDNVDESAALAVKYGIIDNEEIAAAALPYCNITYIDNEEMRTALGGYLEILSKYDMQSVGGSLPDDGFYFNESSISR